MEYWKAKSIMTHRDRIVRTPEEKRKAQAEANQRWWKNKTPEEKEAFKLRRSTVAEKIWYNRKSQRIAQEEYQVMLDKQNNLCAICRRPNPYDRRFHVDHDHVTGLVRGLLCQDCNLGLGHFADSTERLIKALAYLQKAPKGQNS